MLPPPGPGSWTLIIGIYHRSHCGSSHFRLSVGSPAIVAPVIVAPAIFGMTTPKSSREWLDESLTDRTWISQRKFVLFITNGTPPQNPRVSNSIWEGKWRYSPWERKRLNGKTKEPELLLQYQELCSAKLVYDLASHLCLFPGTLLDNGSGEDSSQSLGGRVKFATL